jgi:hypothetical protein
MPHDAELVAETKAWFERAHADIRAADHEWSADPPLLDAYTRLTREDIEAAIRYAADKG